MFCEILSYVLHFRTKMPFLSFAIKYKFYTNYTYYHSYPLATNYLLVAFNTICTQQAMRSNGRTYAFIYQFSSLLDFTLQREKMNHDDNFLSLVFPCDKLFRVSYRIYLDSIPTLLNAGLLDSLKFR